jgi:hypothetical protein
VPGSPVGPKESEENKASVSRSPEHPEAERVSPRDKDFCPWEVGDISRLPFFLSLHLFPARCMWMDG